MSYHQSRCSDAGGPIRPKFDGVAQPGDRLAHRRRHVGVELHGRVDGRQLGNHARIPEVDVGRALRTENACGRCVDIPQQPVSNPVVRNGFKGVVDGVQLLKRTARSRMPAEPGSTS